MKSESEVQIVRPKLDHPFPPQAMPTTKGERQGNTGKAAKRSARKGKGKEKEASINNSGPSRTLPHTTSKEDPIPWNWSYLAEPQTAKLPPVFTKDAK